jgi:putative ABC transport system ATP-binding protein
MISIVFPLIKKFHSGKEIIFDLPVRDEYNSSSSVTIDLPPKFLYSIYGNNGMGKTTIMNIISSLTEFEGSIQKNGKGFTISSTITNGTNKDENLSELRDKNFSFIFQDPHLINFYTLAENLKLVNSSFNYNNDINKLIKSVERLRLKEKYKINISRKLEKFITEKDNTPYYLSGGEKQLLSFIRSMIKPSNILFADEPWASMDQYMKSFIESQFYDYTIDKDIFSNIRNRNKKLLTNKIVIIISHPVHHQEKISFGIKTKEWSKNIQVFMSESKNKNEKEYLSLEQYSLKDITNKNIGSKNV